LATCKLSRHEKILTGESRRIKIMPCHAMQCSSELVPDARSESRKNKNMKKDHENVEMRETD